jgi:hypothetical protein
MTFVQTVLRYEGTPYHHQGRLPGVGMDCPAPLICGAREEGIKPRNFDVTGYPAEPDGVSLKRLCDEHLEPIALENVRPADVLLTAWARGNLLPRHLGIVIDATPGRMYWLQAENLRYHRVIVTRVMFGSDGMQLVQAYRIPGLA